MQEGSPALAFTDISGLAPDMAGDLSGIDLAIDRSAGWLRRIVWIDTTENGTVTEYDSEPDVSFMRRTSVWFLGLLPIESQL